MERILLDETASTNSWLAARASTLGKMATVRARRQTSGRGQRGNSWESEPDKNLTLSLLWKPESFAASAQFAISEAVALAVVDTLARHGIEAKVKWPNDIYAGEKKICGILIEHAVIGRGITQSICGVGLNVNQTEFLSDAPNPVSMKQLKGCEFNLDDLSATLEERMSLRLTLAEEEGGRLLQHAEYMSLLRRNDGAFHLFGLPSGSRFEAQIADVGMDGLLSLRLHDGSFRSFAFKEVSFL